MIRTRKDLNEYLELEKKLYFSNKSHFKILFEYITHESCVQIWKFQKYLRITEYYYNNRKSILNKFLYSYYLRRKNIRGRKLGFTISINSFDKGLKIEHYGNITVNGFVRVGKNCVLHGNNCIGNKGVGRSSEYPLIGDDFDLGFGANVIGNVSIRNNVKVGANAVVTKSFTENNIVLIGIPAVKLKKKEK